MSLNSLPRPGVYDFTDGNPVYRVDSTVSVGDLLIGDWAKMNQPSGNVLAVPSSSYAVPMALIATNTREAFMRALDVFDLLPSIDQQDTRPCAYSDLKLASIEKLPVRVFLMTAEKLWKARRDLSMVSFRLFDDDSELCVSVIVLIGQKETLRIKEIMDAKLRQLTAGLN